MSSFAYSGSLLMHLLVAGVIWHMASAHDATPPKTETIQLVMVTAGTMMVQEEQAAPPSPVEDAAPTEPEAVSEPEPEPTTAELAPPAPPVKARPKAKPVRKQQAQKPKAVSVPKQVSASQAETNSVKEGEAGSDAHQAITQPRPKSSFRNAPPHYPKQARRQGIEGTVLIAMIIQTDGTPRNIRIQRSSGSVLLDQAALDAVKQWRFQPAYHGKTPIEASIVVPIAFTLTAAR